MATPNIEDLLVGKECLVRSKEDDELWVKTTITRFISSNGYWICEGKDGSLPIKVCQNTDRRLIIGKDDKTTLSIYNERIETISKRQREDMHTKIDEWKSIFVHERDNEYYKVEFNGDDVSRTNISAEISVVGMANDEETEDEDQQLEKREQELNEKEQKLDEREGALGRIMQRSQDDSKKRKLELDNREKELDNRDEENKKRKLELDNLEKELDKRKEENDGNGQHANKQTLLDGIMQYAEETKHPMAVLAVKELEELLSTNNTTQMDQDVDQKIANVLQRFQSCMHSIVEREFTYSTKEYCNIISILTESHSKDVTTKKEELASNELHDNKSKVENCVNEAKAKIKEKILVESYSKVVEEGEASLKEIDTQLKTLYSNANEELKKKYNDKLSVIMKMETDDEITLEEDKNTKAEWNNYIEKDHFANY